MTKKVIPTLLLFLLASLPVFSQSVANEPKTATYAKAKNMMIKEINFDAVGLEEALTFFQKESQSLDPDKNGLNFILKKPADPNAKVPTLSLNLKKVPLADVLRYVGSLTNYEVKYEENAIVLTPPETVKKP